MPKGEDAKKILKKNPAEISFAIGTTAGESSAKAVTQEQSRKIIMASRKSKEAFDTTEIKDFDTNNLYFSIDLMKKGNVDPKTYGW